MKEAVKIHKRRIPRALMVLDAAGAVLVAIGVLDLLQGGPGLVPESLPSPATGILLVALGVILMLAVPAWLLRAYRRDNKNHGDSPLGP
jgi:hypothetical protein